MKIHRFTYYSQGQWTQTKCYNHKRRSCFAMCFILALKKTFIYLCSVCSYHFVYLDLYVTVFCLLITTNAYNSFFKPNWRQKPKFHPFVNLLAPRSERSVSGHGLQFHMICNICITWIWSKLPRLGNQSKEVIWLTKILLGLQNIHWPSTQKLTLPLILLSEQSCAWKKEISSIIYEVCLRQWHFTTKELPVTILFYLAFFVSWRF